MPVYMNESDLTISHLVISTSHHWFNGQKFWFFNV